jgi:hypothetical protein
MERALGLDGHLAGNAAEPYIWHCDTSFLCSILDSTLVDTIMKPRLRDAPPAIPGRLSCWTCASCGGRGGGVVVLLTDDSVHVAFGPRVPPPHIRGLGRRRHALHQPRALVRGRGRGLCMHTARQTLPPRTGPNLLGQHQRQPAHASAKKTKGTGHTNVLDCRLFRFRMLLRVLSGRESMVIPQSSARGTSPGPWTPSGHVTYSGAPRGPKRRISTTHPTVYAATKYSFPPAAAPTAALRLTKGSCIITRQLPGHTNHIGTHLNQILAAVVSPLTWWCFSPLAASTVPFQMTPAPRNPTPAHAPHPTLIAIMPFHGVSICPSSATHRWESLPSRATHPSYSSRQTRRSS